MSTASAHAAMLRRWIWRDFANIILGVWLIASPSTLGYRDPLTALNDAASGALIVVLATLTLWPRFDLVRWALCLTGIWLLFAPLVLWAPDPAAYSNDTLVGVLVIAFSVLIPMMPSRAHHQVMMTPGPDMPPGWSYNPSDWTQRGPIIAMALVGFFLSRYLAAYQLGYTTYPWDPFFGDGTKRVLDSEVSRAWPISDAGLGAVSYMLEVLSGFMGARNRWRTMPWMVLMFGVLVVPLGVVSILLVIMQPVAVGAWCTLCLVTAFAMLVMISPALDEVVAMWQFLLAARREGKPLWRTFWVGGTLEQYPSADPADSAAATRLGQRSIEQQIFAALDLKNAPWTLVVSAALGVWLMAAPSVLGAGGRMADSNHLAGALVVTWSVIAFGEIARPTRLLNIPMGLLTAAAPWYLPGATGVSCWADAVAGVLLMALAIPRGRIEERFAGWNRYLV
ncbi:MAG: vitamin K epoxide reductase family protein [Acidobacteria bacterium]|nr:MAG: vitamin K epoxide reductase family protein [Acidobacteriota bacterium]